MVAVTGKRKGIWNTVEKYRLSARRTEADNIWIGAAICYLIATDRETVFRSLYAESETGENISLGRFGNWEVLKDISAFSRMFIDACAGAWHLECLIGGVGVVFYGHSMGTVVGVQVPEGADVDVIPLLKRIELMTRRIRRG